MSYWKKSHIGQVFSRTKRCLISGYLLYKEWKGRSPRDRYCCSSKVIVHFLHCSWTWSVACCMTCEKAGRTPWEREQMAQFPKKNDSPVRKSSIKGTKKKWMRSCKMRLKILNGISAVGLCELPSQTLSTLRRFVQRSMHNACVPCSLAPVWDVGVNYFFPSPLCQLASNCISDRLCDSHL